MSNYFKPTNLIVGMEQITNSKDSYVELNGVKPEFLYEDNKKTTTIIGHYYIFHVPNNNNLIVRIKIRDGETPLIQPVEIAEKGSLLVTFEGLKANFYVGAKGYVEVSLSATNIIRKNS